MSKAFTRESDEEPELPQARVSPLPPGAKNYLTPAGAQRLRAELEELARSERSQAASAPDPDTARRERQSLLQRTQQIEQSLQTAEIVPPPAQPWEQVHFGATVTVRDRGGIESDNRLVGADEMDIDRDWVSWFSPVGRALLNARLGERIRFRVPSGERELEIIKITYE